MAVQVTDPVLARRLAMMASGGSASLPTKLLKASLLSSDIDNSKTTLIQPVEMPPMPGEAQPEAQMARGGRVQVQDPVQMERMQKMADGGAAFGIYPSSGKRPEELNVSRDVNAPAQVARGSLAGTLGLFGDLEGLIRTLRNIGPMPAGVSTTPVLPTSEFFLDYLPGGDQSPAGKFFGHAGAMTGGMGVAPLARATKAAAKAAAPTAAQIAEEILMRQGLMPGVMERGSRGATDLAGALRPEKAPVRGETSKELQRMQKGVLNEQQQERLDQLLMKYPNLSEAVKFMTPQELVKTVGNPEGAREMSRLLEVLPNAKQLAAVTKAGSEKQGWYRASTQALIDVFGIEDAPRFAALLASTSPQTSVEMNLKNALNIWGNWTKAGRPTDPTAIKSIMGSSVAGTKGEESVLGAWINNSVRALTAPDPTKIVLSGPKVDSFFRNLADDVYRVTNDAWMSNGLKISQSMFGGAPTELQLLRGDPGLSPGYIATNVRMRQAGQKANMFPSEAQETAWSWFMPLMEMQTATGIPARELLQRGALTPEMIRGTPDFSTLLKQGEYGRILESAGYGEKLAGMKPYEWQRPNYALTSGEQADLERIAGNLENLGRMRASGRRLTTMPAGTGQPQTGFATINQEFIPGRGTGHAEELIGAPLSQREAFSAEMARAFNDPQMRNRLMTSVGMEPLPTARYTGSYRPEGGIPFAGPRAEEGLRAPTLAPFPAEVNPGYAYTQEVPLRYKRGEPTMLPADEARLRAIATLQGGMTAQHGTPFNMPVRSPTGEGLYVPLEKRVDEDKMRMLAATMNPATEAVADTGRGVNVLNWGDPFSVETRNLIAQNLGGTSSVPVKNVGQYVDLSGELMQPGTGAVTRRILEAHGALPVKQQQALSEASKQTAGDIYDIYQGLQERKGYELRPDIMNMLDVLRKAGIVGLPAALASGVSLASEGDQASGALAGPGLRLPSP